MAKRKTQRARGPKVGPAAHNRQGAGSIPAEPKINTKLFDNIFNLDPRQIRPNPNNTHGHDEENMAEMKASVERYGWLSVVVLFPKQKNRKPMVCAGHNRLQAALELQQDGRLDTIPCIYANHLTKEQAEAFGYDDNQITKHGYDLADKLRELAPKWDKAQVRPVTMSLNRLRKLVEESKIKEYKAKRPTPIPMTEQFIIPPFSVFDARQGYWKERKALWLQLGFDSAEGRDADVYVGGAVLEGTSVFDPVLAEVVYRWFCPDGGYIVDPFAGGSVRGIVAAQLGYKYTGVDIRKEQVTVNNKHKRKIMGEGKAQPKWVVGDSARMPSTVKGSADLVFTCPPYYDLEEYSNTQGDISGAQTYDAFLDLFTRCMRNALKRLADDRFCVVVVGDMRCKEGWYRGFPEDTTRIMQGLGVHKYNEIVLVTPTGTLYLRSPQPFKESRKLGKAHQNVLVFYKGDPSTIGDTLGRTIEAAWEGTDG